MNARVLTMSVLAVGALSQGSASAQQSEASATPSIEMVTGPVTQLPPYEYDLRTGTGRFVSDPAVITPGPAGVLKTPVTCYSNIAFVGSLGLPPINNEWVDWGDKSCGMTQFVEQFQIGYASRRADASIGGPGASLDIALYQGTSGGGFAFLGTEIARFAFTGLPGRTGGVGTFSAYSLTITITSGPIPVCDGDIGWGYTDVDGDTGPLLVATTGVCFGAPDPLTGTEDCFDRYTAPASAGGYLGTSAFTTVGRASFWMRIDEHDGSSTTSATVNGTNVNPLIYTQAAPPVLAQPWNTMIDTTAYPGAVATAIAFCDDPFPPTMIGAGELLVDISTPSLLFIDIALGAHTNAAPKDLSLVGNSIHTQGAVYDGMLHLANGIDFTLGL